MGQAKYLKFKKAYSKGLRQLRIKKKKTNIFNKTHCNLG